MIEWWLLVDNLRPSGPSSGAFAGTLAIGSTSPHGQLLIELAGDDQIMKLFLLVVLPCFFVLLLFAVGVFCCCVEVPDWLFRHLWVPETDKKTSWIISNIAMMSQRIVMITGDKTCSLVSYQRLDNFVTEVWAIELTKCYQRNFCSLAFVDSHSTSNTQHFHFLPVYARAHYLLSFPLPWWRSAPP